MAFKDDKFIANHEDGVVDVKPTASERGRSHCKFCEASGELTIGGQRQWTHKPDCAWIAARERMGEPYLP